MEATVRSLQVAGGFPFELRHSPSAELEAQQAAETIAASLPVIAQALGFSPSLKLLVLSREDWPHFAERAVYGMPHNVQGDTIVIGKEPPGFWDDIVTMLQPSLSPAELIRLRDVYGERGGIIDTRPFTSLALLHQLGHIFHQQVPFTFPRRWLRELFANLCVYTAVAEALPRRLPQLETLPRILSEAASQLAARRTLAEFDSITVASAEIFAWYQLRLLLAARSIHEAEGAAALRRFFDLFLRCCGRELSDDELADLLDRKVAPEAALLMRTWPDVP